MLRIPWATCALFVIAATLVAAPQAASPNFPAKIALPTGWTPEGIAIGNQHTYYYGHTGNGSIMAGDLRTGAGSILVQAMAGRSAFGIFPDHRDRLWVAGGATGEAYVYDAGSGDLIAKYVLEPPTTLVKRINDVYVTRTAAYFTCGSVTCTRPGPPVLYKIPIGPNGELGTTVEYVPMRADMTGLNGIEATPDGKTLLVGQSATGKIFKVDTETNEIAEVTLSEPLPRTDGLILDGKTLYSVSNLPNGYIAVVELTPDLSSGVVVEHLNTEEGLHNPATADEFGHLIYVLARSAPGVVPIQYWLTRLEKPTGH